MTKSLASEVSDLANKIKSEITVNSETGEVYIPTNLYLKLLPDNLRAVVAKEFALSMILSAL